MERYVIKINYTASYTAVVEGNFRNEGDALDAARNQAEDADMNEFILGEELSTQIISR